MNKKIAIITGVILILSLLLGSFNYMISEKVKKSILSLVQSEKSIVKLNKLDCTTLYLIKSSCDIDLDIMDINKKNYSVMNISGTFNTDNYKSNIHLVDLILNPDKDNLYNKLLLFPGNKNELSLESFSYIYKNVFHNIILKAKIDKPKNNELDITADLDNRIFKIKTISNLEKRQFKDSKITQIKDKRYKLPSVEIYQKYLKNEFIIKKPEELKKIIYEYYKLNYFHSENKYAVNDYFLSNNSDKLASEEDFNKIITDLIKTYDLKSQNLYILNIFKNPIVSIYLNKNKLSDTYELKKEIPIFETLLGLSLALKENNMKNK